MARHPVIALACFLFLPWIATGCSPLGGDNGTPDLPDLEGDTGPLSGYVYLVPPPEAPAEGAAARQLSGATFILAFAENAELGQPAPDGTTLTADSSESTTTTAGAFAFDALPVGLRTVTVTGTVNEAEATDVFENIILVPGTRETPTFSVQVTPNDLSKVERGETRKMTAKLIASGREVAAYPASDFTWTSAMDAIATVDETGTVTGVAGGQVRIAAATGGVAGAAAVWVPSTTTLATGVPWQGSVTSYMDNDGLGYNFGSATLVKEVSSSSGDADFHMDDVGQIHAWSRGAVNMGASVEFNAEIQPPSDGFDAEPVSAAVGEVVAVRMRKGGVAALRVIALETTPRRRMDFDFIILSR